MNIRSTVALNALATNEEIWRTTEHGHKIAIEDGVVTKGNPYVLEKMKPASKMSKVKQLVSKLFSRSSSKKSSTSSSPMESTKSSVKKIRFKDPRGLGYYRPLETEYLRRLLSGK